MMLDAENERSNNMSPPSASRRRSARKPLRGGKLGSGLARRTPSPTRFPHHDDDGCSSSSGSCGGVDAADQLSPVYTEVPPSPTGSSGSVSSTASLGAFPNEKQSVEPASPRQHPPAPVSWGSLVALAVAVLAAVAFTAFAGASAGAQQLQQQQQQKQHETLRHAAPRVANSAFLHSVALGDPFEFELDVTGSPPPRVQWRLNGVNLPGKTSPKLSVASAQLAHSGTYTCALDNVAGKLVWEEAYLTVVEDSSSSSTSDSHHAEASSSSNGDSAAVRHARTCLLRRAPDALMRAAAVDGGAALIAAGDATGYLACFPALAKHVHAARADAARAQQQTRALDLLRSMHGTSKKRSLLVNVLAALDEVCSAQEAGRATAPQAAQAAFETGLYCASTPRCAGTSSSDGADARARVVGIVLGALN